MDWIFAPDKLIILIYGLVFALGLTLVACVWLTYKLNKLKAENKEIFEDVFAGMPGQLAWVVDPIEPHKLGKIVVDHAGEKIYLPARSSHTIVNGSAVITLYWHGGAWEVKPLIKRFRGTEEIEA